MRVIAGSARRLLLKAPLGDNTRPTTDRIKETLFNMIQNEVPGSVFLDLFAGSGGIGIEALSRSAINRLSGKGVFDIVFMDPPYDKELERRVLEYLTMSKLIHEDTLIIFEASLDTDISYLEDLGYELIKEKKYKTNKHVFVQRSKR